MRRINHSGTVIASRRASEGSKALRGNSVKQIAKRLCKKEVLSLRDLFNWVAALALAPSGCSAARNDGVDACTMVLFVSFFVLPLHAQEESQKSVTMTVEENLKEAPKKGLGSTDGQVPKKIQVGAVISLTGKTKELAKYIKQGYELGVEKINKRGGVRVGSSFAELELVFADDASDMNVAPRAAESLVKQGIDYMLGPYGSALTDVVYPIAEKYKIPLITQGSVEDLYDQNLRYIFNPNSSGDQYLRSAVKMLGEVAISTGRKPEDLKVAIISRDDSGSKGIRAGVAEAVKEWKMQLVADIVVGAGGNKDVTAALDKVNALLPDLLVATVQAEGATFFVSEYARKKIDIPMVAMTHCDAAKLGELKPKSDYLICASQWDAFMNYSDRYFGSTVEYTTDYYLKYNMVPPYQAGGATTAVLLLTDAIERAQSLDREKVRDALAATNLNTLYGGIRFDDKKDKAKPIILYQLMQGEYKIVYPQNVAWARPIYPIPSWEERIAD